MKENKLTIGPNAFSSNSSLKYRFLLQQGHFIALDIILLELHWKKLYDQEFICRYTLLTTYFKQRLRHMVCIKGL